MFGEFVLRLASKSFSDALGKLRRATFWRAARLVSADRTAGTSLLARQEWNRPGFAPNARKTVRCQFWDESSFLTRYFAQFLTG